VFIVRDRICILFEWPSFKKITLSLFSSYKKGFYKKFWAYPRIKTFRRLWSNSYRYDPREELEELQMQLLCRKNLPYLKLLETDLNPFILTFPKNVVGFESELFSFLVFWRGHQFLTRSINLSISISKCTQNYKILFLHHLDLTRNVLVKLYIREPLWPKTYKSKLKPNRFYM